MSAAIELMKETRKKCIFTQIYGDQAFKFNLLLKLK
jgi:hypothetical protein